LTEQPAATCGQPAALRPGYIYAASLSLLT
jgi:hypothetical protein